MGARCVLKAVLRGEREREEKEVVAGRGRREKREGVEGSGEGRRRGKIVIFLL